jgi:hypothetical protein
MKRPIAVPMGVAVAAAVAPAWAQTFLGPSPYLQTSDSPIASLPGFGYFHLEDFEDGALNTPGLTASDGTVLAPGDATDSVDADDGVVDGSGQRGHSWYSRGTLTFFDFTFDAGVLGALPTHAGLVWTDVGTVFSGAFATGPVTFEAFGPGGATLGSIGPVILGDGRFTGQTGEDRFFGVINPAGISRIRVSMSNSADWEVDHVQYGFIPTPGAASVLVLAGLSVLRRTRR